LGISFAFDDPGDTLIFVASAAWDFSTRNLYAAGTLLTGNDALLVDADYTFTYADERFSRSVARVSLSSLVDVGGNFTATFSNTAQWSGIEDLSQGGYSSRILDTAQIRLSNLRRYGKSYYATGGVTIAPFYQIYHTDTRSLYQHVGLAASVSFPQLLPFRNPGGITVNLPFALGASLFPGPDTFLHYYASAVLFSAEIQRAIPYVSIFFRRFAIEAQYIHRTYRVNESFDVFRIGDLFSHIDSDPADDTLVFAFIPELGINTGALANVGFQVSMELQIDLKAEQFAPTFGVTLGLRY
jgi:hypothetical protein